MPGFNPEKINIYDLTVEEPEKESELPFDLERDITAEDWSGIEIILNDERKKNIIGFSHRAYCVKILNPEYDLKIGEDTRRAIEYELNTSPKIEDNNAKMLARVKIFDTEFGVGIKKNRFEDEFNKLRKKNSFGAFCDLTVAVKILDPDCDLHLTDKDYEKSVEYANNLKNNNAWWDFFNMAANIKIVFKDRNFQIDSIAWGKAKDMLRESRKNYYSFVTLASQMKILATDKVDITEEGFKFIKNKKPDLQSEAQQIPEQRQF